MNHKENSVWASRRLVAHNLGEIFVEAIRSIEDNPFFNEILPVSVLAMDLLVPRFVEFKVKTKISIQKKSMTVCGIREAVAKLRYSAFCINNDCPLDIQVRSAGACPCETLFSVNCESTIDDNNTIYLDQNLNERSRIAQNIYRLLAIPSVVRLFVSRYQDGFHHYLTGCIADMVAANRKNLTNSTVGYVLFPSWDSRPKTVFIGVWRDVLPYWMVDFIGL